MSNFDAAPPNTHAGGNDDALRTKGNDPMNAPLSTTIVADATINMEEYARTVPKWKRVWQHSLTQMVLLSVQAFCGPAMADAIAGKIFTRKEGGDWSKILQGLVEVVSLHPRRRILLPR